jgi:hypothetical protein
MNTPSLWFHPRNFPNRLMGSYDFTASPDRFIFLDGKPLEQSDARPTFHFSAQRWRLLKFGVLPNEVQVPLVSPRAASILAEFCPNDFQLFPTTIHTRDAPIDDYYLLNVVVGIYGIDHARSRSVLFPDSRGIMKLEQLRYVPGAIGDHDLAREREYEPYLWVSDNLVKIFTQEKIRGCVFEPPESIHP